MWRRESARLYYASPPAWLREHCERRETERPSNASAETMHNAVSAETPNCADPVFHVPFMGVYQRTACSLFRESRKGIGFEEFPIESSLRRELSVVIVPSFCRK
jgi:hypothetical protein